MSSPHSVDLIKERANFQGLTHLALARCIGDIIGRAEGEDVTRVSDIVTKTLQLVQAHADPQVRLDEDSANPHLDMLLGEFADRVYQGVTGYDTFRGHNG